MTSIGTWALATRTRYLLINAHSGHKRDFAPVVPSLLRAKFKFFKPRHPHSGTILVPCSTECDGQHKSRVSTGAATPVRAWSIRPSKTASPLQNLRSSGTSLYLASTYRRDSATRTASGHYSTNLKPAASRGSSATRRGHELSDAD
jgi:hypothetical protein